MSAFTSVVCTEPIYDSKLEIFIGAEREPLQNELNKRHPNNYFIFPENARAFHASPTNTGNHYVWIKHYDPNCIEDITTIAHEIIHYCTCTLDKVGVPFNRENDEALTHLFEYTFQKVLTSLAKLNKER